MTESPGPAVAYLSEDVADPDEPLHIVARSTYPRALCGALVHDPFDPNRADTAGRDRCTQCLKIAGDSGLRL